MVKKRKADRASEPVAFLKNLGPTSRSWLDEINIRTIDDLRRTGSVVAYRLVKDRQPAASLNLLWALAAALRGIDWRELSAIDKDDLRTELAQLEE